MMTRKKKKFAIVSSLVLLISVWVSVWVSEWEGCEKEMWERNIEGKRKIEIKIITC